MNCENPKYKPKKWWDTEVKVAIQNRKKACKAHRQEKRRGGTDEEVKQKWETYLELKMEAKKIITGKISEMNRKIEQEIKNAGRNAGKKFWQYLKSKREKRGKKTFENREHAGGGEDRRKRYQGMHFRIHDSRAR